MKIEELYVRGNEVNHLQDTVQIRVAPASRLSTPSFNKKPSSTAKGSKLVRGQTISNMRLEQLNKHEELSYIEDAEANEAILKNTVSKDELCRYLTPLKFLEIETWRKEVPCGENLDESEVEHRKWRTPIEILLPTAGKEEDGSSSSQEANDAKNKESSGRKKAISAYSRRRKFFEDVQRQNAEVLRRSNSDATKTTRQPLKDPMSAGEKPVTRQRIPGQSEAERNQNTMEFRLRTAYAPGNPIPPIKESTGPKLNRNNGHIHVNQTAELPLAHAGIMTSYFAPGKPVLLSRARGRANPEPLRRHSAENGETNKMSQNSNNGTPPSSQKISSASWPRPTNENNTRHLERIGVQEEVQVLPFNIVRPQTVGDQFAAGRYETYQRHTKFRGASRNVSRGWRTWNNRRVIENSFNAATKLYQNSVVPKKSHPSRILEKIRGVRTANGTRDGFSGSQRRSNSLDRMGESKNKSGSGDDIPKTSTTKDNTLSNHVTKISYAVSRPQENISKGNPEKSRVTAVPPIDIKVSSSKHIPKDFSHLPGNQEVAPKNGLRYRNADGVIELSSAQNGKASAPWVAEAFCPTLAMNDNYYMTHQRPAKTVTFRLGAT